MRMEENTGTNGYFTIFNSLIVTIQLFVTLFHQDFDGRSKFMVLLTLLVVAIASIVLFCSKKNSLYRDGLLEWMCIVVIVSGTFYSLFTIYSEITKPRGIYEGRIIPKNGGVEDIDINIVKNDENVVGQALLPDDNGRFAAESLETGSRYKVFIHRLIHNDLQWTVLEIVPRKKIGLSEDLAFPSKQNKAYRLETVFFEKNSAKLGDKAKKTIKAIGGFINSDMIGKKYQLLILGHCSTPGSDERNMRLGSDRATRVKKALIKEKIPPNNLFAISYGEIKPTILGSGPNIHAQNRRVEFILLPLFEPRKNLAKEYAKFKQNNKS